MKAKPQPPSSPIHPSLIQATLVLDQASQLGEFPKGAQQKCVRLLTELLLTVAKAPIQEGGNDEQR